MLLHDREVTLSIASFAKLLPGVAAKIFSRCRKERTAGRVGTVALPQEKHCPLLPDDEDSLDCCRPRTWS